MTQHPSTTCARSQSGFTLIELLMVVFIIGLLASIAIPIFNGQRERAQRAVSEQKLQTALRVILSAQRSDDVTLPGNFNIDFLPTRYSTSGSFLNTELNRDELSIDINSFADTTPISAIPTGAIRASLANSSGSGYTHMMLCTAYKGKHFLCLRYIETDPNGSLWAGNPTFEAFRTKNRHFTWSKDLPGSATLADWYGASPVNIRATPPAENTVSVWAECRGLYSSPVCRN